MNTFDLGTLDLDKRWRGKTVLMRQGDKSGTVITASLRDHGTALNTSGLTARWQMRLPNGVDYYRRGATYDAGTVSVTIDETTAASVAGETVGYFQVLQGSSVIASTEPVKVVILPDALADAKPSESYDNAIQDAIEALEQATNTIPEKVIAEVDAQLAAHPEWTTTVQDGSITKAKLATDLARDRERLMYRLANMLTATLPEGETATATDAAQTPVAGLALYGKSTQDGTPTPSAPVPIVSVAPDSQGNISLWARGNLLDPSTFGVRGGGVDIISGGFVSDSTPTVDYSGWTWAHRTFDVTLPAGTYTVCCCVRTQGRASSGYAVITEAGATLVSPTSGFAPSTFTLDETTNVGIKIKTYEAVVACMVFGGALTANPSAYVFYTATVTPIPLDGHELRSLPDGTRDELRIDGYGHAVLTKRVGVKTYDGTENWALQSGTYPFIAVGSSALGAAGGRPLMSNLLAYTGQITTSTDGDGLSLIADGTTLRVRATGYATVDAWKAKLAETPMTVLYPLATPLTIDLGLVDPIPLVGPELTAQAIPTAPMQLTYERDLNVTLARLESAIAELATN